MQVGVALFQREISGNADAHSDQIRINSKHKVSCYHPTTLIDDSLDFIIQIRKCNGKDIKVVVLSLHICNYTENSLGQLDSFSYPSHFLVENASTFQQCIAPYYNWLSPSGLVPFLLLWYEKAVACIGISFLEARKMSLFSQCDSVQPSIQLMG